MSDSERSDSVIDFVTETTLNIPETYGLSEDISAKGLSEDISTNGEDTPEGIELEEPTSHGHELMKSSKNKKLLLLLAFLAIICVSSLFFFLFPQTNKNNRVRAKSTKPYVPYKQGEFQFMVNPDHPVLAQIIHVLHHTVTQNAQTVVEHPRVPKKQQAIQDILTSLTDKREADLRPLEAWGIQYFRYPFSMALTGLMAIYYLPHLRFCMEQAAPTHALEEVPNSRLAAAYSQDGFVSLQSASSKFPILKNYTAIAIAVPVSKDSREGSWSEHHLYLRPVNEELWTFYRAQGQIQSGIHSSFVERSEASIIIYLRK